MRVEVLDPFSSLVDREGSIEPRMAQLVSTRFHHSRDILKLYFFFSFFFCFFILLVNFVLTC